MLQFFKTQCQINSITFLRRIGKRKFYKNNQNHFVCSRYFHNHSSTQFHLNFKLMGSITSKPGRVSSLCKGSQDDIISNRNMSSENMDDIIVCNSEDVPEEGLKSFDLPNGKVLLAKHKGKLYAIGDKCTHYGAPLENGALCNGRVRCPWHGACFNLESGDIEDFPGLDSIPTFDVTEKDGKVTIRDTNQLLGKSKRLKNMTKRNPEVNTRFVIVGGGAAGAKCVETLRQEGFDGELIMLTNESILPYDRPKLTKAMNLLPSQIILRNEQFYQDADIDIKLNSEVTKIDPDTKSILLSDNQSLHYDKLFLATGGSPRKLNCPGHDLEGIHVIRKPEDANTVNQEAKCKTVVVIGGSFIGGEVVAYLSQEDRCDKVIMINHADVPFQRGFGTDIGRRIQALFEENGVQVFNNAKVTEINGQDGKVTSVTINGEKTINTDLVVLGIGVTPSTEYLEGTNIERQKYGHITVNKYLETSVNDVYCGGDIASFPLSMEEDASVSIGHWQIAHYHGHIAALNMMGKAKKVETVPYFWSAMYGKNFRYTGHGFYDDIIISGDLDALSFVAYYCNGDKVIAIASLMKDPATSRYAEMLQQGRFLMKNEVLEDKDIIFKIDLAQF